ncbi:MAG: hypothetical protein PHE43_04610 [Candidatus Nanoarchaeia archaeon]|nr:hypothetical protein [Candidatus Nanoarchaeia archaeon]
MLNEIISDIKREKSYSNVSNKIIRNLSNKILVPIVESYLKENKPNLDSKREYLKTIKEIRKNLEMVYGIYNPEIKKRYLLLKQLKKDPTNEEIYGKILSTHISSKERLEDYEKIYKEIFEITGKPKKILDLASGINPVSLPFMHLDNITYIAVELNPEDIKFLKEYFSIVSGIYNLKTEIIQKNLIEKNSFPESDVCFIFKALDNLETLRQGVTRYLLKSIPTKYFVISFPTKTLYRKNLNIKRLAWFNKLVKQPVKIKTGNEIFYIVKKENIY